ncbi:MAG: hypothetical protein J6S68_07025 [Acinetobacter sp.]|nr:hypothetical protein [Acinetobacter sp.]
MLNLNFVDNERSRVRSLRDTVSEFAVVVNLQMNLKNNDTFKPLINDLEAKLAEIEAWLGREQLDLSVEGRQKKAREEAKRLKSSFKALVAAGRKKRLEFKKRREDYANLEFSDKFPPEMRIEIRATFAKIKGAGPQFDFAIKADLRTLSAILETGPAMSDLPSDLYHKLQDRHAVLKLVDRAATTGSHDLKPSLSDILAVGIDTDRAISDAEKTVKSWVAEEAIIDDLSQYLEGVVNWTALLTNTNNADAFEMLMA